MPQSCAFFRATRVQHHEFRKLPAARISLPPDTLADPEELEYGPLAYPILLHESMGETLPDVPGIRRRLSLVLQHLAANGRPSVVKGCNDPQNRGWRRTPMGGSGGMQYYLWWTVGGSRMIPADVHHRLGMRRSIWVRTVRHHDDVSPLDPGDTSNEYYPLAQPDITGQDEAFVETPWTESQLAFVRAPEPIRIVYGHPGSGKTTTLWRAVTSHTDEGILYTTWSRELAQLASAYFDTFGPASNRVSLYDVRTLLGMLCRRDIPRLTQGQQVRALSDAIADARIQRGTLGPWSGRMEELYAEIRAVLLGMAVNAESTVRTQEGYVRLSRNGYMHLRAGEGGIGERAADAFMAIISRLERNQSISAIYPEIIAASTALDLLRKDLLPDGFDEFDRVVIDEVQDLTLVEVHALTELCLALGRKRGQYPRLLISGDEGQTVRPSGFDWGQFNDLLNRQFSSSAREVALETRLRSPRRISGVLRNASTLYRSLERGLRPSNQNETTESQATDARLFHVQVSDVNRACELIATLSHIDNLAVITAEAEAPSWLDPGLGNIVLTPQAVKGLEYQVVCLLNPGQTLLSIIAPASEYADAPGLDRHMTRTLIDRYRVALSRSTETLVFIDVTPTPEAAETSLKVLGDPIPCTPEQLIEYLAETDTLEEDRVMLRIRESRDLLDSDPPAAWNRTVQAESLLGNPNLPNGVADPEVRASALTNLLFVGARILVDRAEVDIDEVSERCRAAAQKLDGSSHVDAFIALEAWLKNPGDSLIPLLNELTRLDRTHDWLGNTLASLYQTLQSELERLSTDPESCMEFSGPVDQWLLLSGYTGEVRERANTLRLAAFRTLINTGDKSGAKTVLAALEIQVAAESAEMEARESRHDLAAYLYEHAQMPGEARQSSIDHIEALLADAANRADERLYSDALLRCEAIRDFCQDWPIPDNLLDNYVYTRGMAYWGLSMYEESLERYERLIEIATDDSMKAGGYNGRANVRFRTGDHDRALDDCLRAIELDPDDNGYYGTMDSPLLLAAMLYSSRQQYEESIQYGGRFLDLHPNDVECIILLGNNHQRLGNYEKAIQLRDRAEEAGGVSDTTRFLTALVLASQEQYPEAIEQFDRAIEMNPSNWAVLMYRGYVHAQLGNLETAAADYDNCINHLGPNSGRVLPFLCRADMRMKQGLHAAAMIDINWALSITPDELEFRVLRLEAHFEAGDYSAALEDCSEIVRLGGTGPDLFVIMTFLGMYLEMESETKSLQSETTRNANVRDKGADRLTQALVGRSVPPEIFSLPPVFRIREELLRSNLGLVPASEIKPPPGWATLVGVIQPTR